MPATLTTPGVYVQELPSGVHPITGVATSETAFIDFFPRGPMNVPTNVTSWAEFVRTFGGLDERSESSYAIYQYFVNGGTSAWVVRIAAGSPAPATGALLSGGNPVLNIAASSPGKWGTAVQYAVDTDQISDTTSFNLTVREVQPTDNPSRVVSAETYRNISLDPTSARFAPGVINPASKLVEVSIPGGASTDRPAPLPTTIGSDPTVAFDPTIGPFTALDGTANDGSEPDLAAYTAGIPALDKMAPFIFNLLCLPGATALGPSDYKAVLGAADNYCTQKRAFLIVDVPKDTNRDGMITLIANGTLPDSANAAVYFPRLNVADPLSSGQDRDIGASGAVAGVIARIDASRGVWKSAAGTEATLLGIDSLDVTLTEADNGKLNMLGVNALRTFPIYGNVVWGARTLQGSDAQASEWKYSAVRRTALYIEESLVQGLAWAVFEPNAAPLWAELRLNVGSFLNVMFRQGAFAGTTPRDAYFVKCDGDTTTQDDVDRGVVNVLVGFSPLKPAEFVVIQIQQMAGQTQT